MSDSIACWKKMNTVANYNFDDGFKINKFYVVDDLIFVLGTNNNVSECVII